MSHFTNLKTSFQNFLYLKTALNRLQIDYKLSNSIKNNILILQPNGYDFEFCWNGQEYELSVDLSFWNYPYPIETFIDKIAQEYANEVIVGESQKMGFEPIAYEQNSDGSNTLILERWNQNN